MSLQSRQQARGTKRKRAGGKAACHHEGEEEEEEVEVEVEDDDTQHDRPDDDGDPDPAEEVVLMQTGRGGIRGRPTAKEEAWRPLNPQEKQRMTDIIEKALLEFRRNAEPSLTVLAYVESPPTLCGCEPESGEDSDMDVSLGELRPALLRWLQ